MTSLDADALGPAGTTSAELRLTVEDFLFHEADLLDRWRLDEWLALFTDECTFLVPSTDRPDGDPFTEMFLIQDDRFLLEQRPLHPLNGAAQVDDSSGIQKVNMRAASMRA